MKWGMQAWAIAALVPAGLVFGQSSSQGPAMGKNPGYDIVTIRPDNFQPMVSGLAFLPSGDLLVLTWRGATGPRADGNPPTVSSYGLNGRGLPTKPRTIYRMSKEVKGRDKGSVTTKEVASDAMFKDPQGICVVGNDVFVGDIDKVVKMIDANGDGVYESAQKLADIPFGQGWFEYSFGPVYKDGFLYMAKAGGVLNTGWPTTQRTKDHGSVVRVPIAGGKYEVFAEGMRAPDGIGSGPDGEIFTWDNQGGWRPASRFDHIRQGKWYGYHSPPSAAGPTGPMETAANGTWVKPAIWGVYNDITQSETQPYFMTQGPFAGQFIFGDNSEGGTYRAYLDKVNGEYQGGIAALTGGLESGVHRITGDEQGHLYLGMVGNGGDGNQGWAGKVMGLQKLIRNSSNPMEIHSVIAREGGLEIVFTNTVAANADQAARYSAEHWRNVPEEAYGKGHKVGVAPLSVGTPQVCSDKKRVFVPLSGLTTDRVVHLTVNGLSSADGGAMFFNQTWYTINNKSTSAPCSPLVSGTGPRLVKSMQGLWTERVGAGSLRVNLPAGTFSVEIISPDGKVLASHARISGSVTFSDVGIGAGVRFLRVVGQGQKLVRPLPL